MKKNKKMLIIGVTILLVAIAIVVGITFLGKNKTHDEANNSLEPLGKYQIANIKESDKEIPKFSFFLRDDENSITISHIELLDKKLKLYEFDAAMYDGWDVKTNNYVGIKLKDFIDAFEIKDYTRLIFETAHQKYPHKSISYHNSIVNDKTYLVFYKDGKLIDKENPIAIKSFDDDERDSLNKVKIIFILREN